MGLQREWKPPSKVRCSYSCMRLIPFATRVQATLGPSTSTREGAKESNIPICHLQAEPGTDLMANLAAAAQR